MPSVREKRSGRGPYIGYWVYKPFFHKKEGRYYVQLVAKTDGAITTTSYARFLYSTSVGAIPSRDMHVDHIDGDRTNDTVSNLRLLSGTDNRKKYFLDARISGRMVTLRCPECGCAFVRERRQTFLAKNGKFTACSRVCSGKFRQKLQAASKSGVGISQLLGAMDSNIISEQDISRRRAIPENKNLEDWKDFTD